MTDAEEVSEEIGTGHPMAIMKTHNEQMGAWDVALVVGGIQSEEMAEQVAELIKEILINDGFAARLDRLQ